MTLDQAKEKIKKIEGRKDPLSSAFVGGRVGFRKPTKKYRQEIERKFNEAAEHVRLKDFIEHEERKIFIKENPKPSPYYSCASELEAGKIYEDCFLGKVIVIRINKATVTIKTASGFTETRKPHFIFK